MSVGLTLGKFAPLHRGHQLVIETALRENERVIVLIYPAEETSIPLSVRAAWIRALYPSVEVIEAWDGPTEVGYSPEITKKHDEYLGRLLNDRAVTRFYSSEPYGEHVSRALGAIDRRVDDRREKVPVSGSAIRSDPYAYRVFVEPVVYRDLIARVVLVGAPSTGKTTLAEALANHFGTTWMPEYGREYWESHNVDRRLSPEQLVEIAEGHREREDAAVLEARKFLFVDTEAIVTSLFARYYHGSALPRLQQLARDSRDRYDVFFLCDDDIPYADTTDRSGEANRALFQLWMREELAMRRIPYVTLSGNIEARLRAAAEFLDGYEKYTSLAERGRGRSRIRNPARQ